MNFLIDENIPYAEEFFAPLGEVTRFSGRDLSPQQLTTTDVLLVRSITKVNQNLLSQAQQLKFVGTATIGEDHIDKELLKERNITFSSAPGCNAISVAEYVISSLFVLAEKHKFNLFDKVVGIVGVGNIGKQLQQRLDALNIRFLLCDPYRQQQEQTETFIDFPELLKQADVVSFHTPLSYDGQFPTNHLLNTDNLPLLKSDICLINASRGEVIDNQALLQHIKYRQQHNIEPIKLVLDVWENEPTPMQELIEYTDLASAHIAGYSLEGKARGTEMLYQKVCEKFSLPMQVSLTQFLPQADVSSYALSLEDNEQESMKKLIHLVYDVRRDDQLFRSLLNEKGFDWLRKNYPVRREWSSVKLSLLQQQKKNINFLQLGFDI